MNNFEKSKWKILRTAVALATALCTVLLITTTIAQANERTKAQTTPPSIIAPANNSWINIKYQVFEWTCSNQTAFQIQFGTDDNWTNGAELWDYTNATSRQNTTYGGSQLEENIYYYWRLRCKDINGVWSDWTKTYNFRVDTTPPGNWGNPEVEGHSSSCWEEKTLVVDYTIDCADYGSGMNWSATEIYWSINWPYDWRLCSNISWEGSDQAGRIYAYDIPYNRDSTAGDGQPLGIRVRIKDIAGNVADVTCWRIKIDIINHKLSGIQNNESWLNTTDWYYNPEVWYTSNVSINLTVPMSMLYYSNGSSIPETDREYYNYTNYSIDNGSWIKYTGNISLTTDGTHTIKYYAVNKGGGEGVTKEAIVKIDKTLPSTSISLEGTMRDSGWYVSDVIARLTGYDTTSYPAYICYRFSNGTWIKTQNPYAESFVVQTGFNSDGIHTVELYCADRANNTGNMVTATVKRDATAPSTTYSLSGNGGTNNWFRSNTQITLNPSDATSGVNYTKYKINDGYWQTGTGFTLTDEGQYTIYYYSVDDAGNIETEKNISVGIDKTVPEVYSVDINSGAIYTNSTAVQLSLSAYDLFSGLWQMQFSNDGTIWSDWIDWSSTTSWNLNSEDGEKKVYFRVRDRAGNQAPAIYDTIILDASLPSTTHSLAGTLGSNGWYVSDVTAALSSSDEISGIDYTKYRINAGNWITYSSPFTISQEGSNTVEFFACDLAGNIESTKSITVRIDKTAPATTNSISGTIGSNGWYISDVTIALSASDALSDVDYTKYRITTGEWFTYSAPFTVSSEGTTHIEFYSADLAGNVESTKSITFKIDKTAPTTTYSLSGSSGNNNWYVSDITLSLSTSDALSGVNKTYYKIETGAGQEGTSLTLTQEGMHTIYYYSTDNASNQEVEKNITVKIDKTAPTTTHSLSGTVGNNNWYVSDVSITLLPSDATSGVTQVYYKINNENIQTGTSIKLTQSGIYTVKYWSADVAGNSEQDQSVTIKIDKGKPIVTLTSPANNEVVVTNTLTLSWSGSDDASGVSYYELQVDNNNDFASPEFSTITTSASATTSLLLDAIYYWRVRAIDNAGNPGDWQTRTFTINTGPPTDLIITINDGAQFTNSTSVTLTLSASSNAYEMCFSNDNSTWSLRETFASTKAWTLAGGDDGIRIVYFKCRSVSGNESKAACDTIILDTTAPTLEISKPQNGTITNKEKIMIEGSVRDLNGIETAEILVNDAIYQLTLESGNFTYLGSLSNGTNIITLRAKDVAQNQAEISIVIIYDPAIPAITIHTPANNSITNNSQCLITGRTDLNCKVIINNLTAEINDTGYFNATIVLAEGLNVISIISINSASTEARITLCVLLDTIPPAPPANLSAEPSEWSNRNIFAVKWREANDATGIKCAWYKLGAPPTGDGDGKLTESRNITIQVSEEGIYTVYVWLEDNAGNANFKNFSTILIKYDYSAPLNKHIINGVLGGEQWYISNVTVTLAPVDNLSGVRSVKYRINNGSWDSYNDKIILSEGVWAVEYYAQDNAGNTQNSKFYIKIDLTPPENVIFQNIPRYINITNVTLSWSKSEDTLSGLKGYRIECNNNLTDWLNTTNYNLNLLEGIYSIRIIVSDLAGNVRYSDFITTICDLTSPVTNILLTSNCTKIPSEDLFGSEVKVEFYFEKDTSGIKETKYKINNTEWHTYNSSFSLEKDGEYTISYYSIDFAGNLEKTKTKHVTIDRKLFPPAVKILFPLDNAEISQNITCSYNASSPLNETLKVKALLFNPTRKALLLENGTNTGSFLLVPSAFLNGNYILEIVVTDSACRYSSDKINISIKNRLIVGLEVDRVEALTRKLPVSVTIRNYYGTGCFYIELYTNGRRADSNFASLQEFELTTLKLFCTVEEASDYELSVKLFTNDRELIEERKIQLKVLSSEDGAKDCAKPLFNLLYLYAIIFVLITICVPSAYLSVRAKKRTQHPIKVNSLEEVTQELEYYKNKLERR